uniref:Long-chain-fatty-acid--CoA ligase n=1 Tax=Heterorhabditis bacteriophora TaxID=37862 RepID=A0A1I7XV00_HETBA
MQVQKHPHKLACVEVESGKELTYIQLNKLMNKYANFFEAEGYKNGDVVSLFMENGIDFFAIWLGLSKIGVISAFINSNLKLEPLAHSIKAAASKSVITSSSLLPTLNAIISGGLINMETMEVFLNDGESTELRVLNQEIQSVSSSEPKNKGIHFQKIWKDFVGRFGIQRIGELYGSTEGNSNIVNLDNHVGSCGFFPIYPHMGSFYPVRLIKVDQETGALIRNKNGLCIPCRPGELGEMVGVIKNKDLLLKFEGYVNKGDTQKKIYRDVFAKGDQVFASGDILFWDELGYLYFKDRRGDTFRWKGENVSTTEVEGILQPVMSVIDATVYGVEVGNNEGKAGMAAVVLVNGINVKDFLSEISKRLTDNLAAYAIPLFMRLCKEVDRTGVKTELQKQGFDLAKCKGDSIYYWNTAMKEYVKLDEKMQNDIETGVYNRI